MLSWKEAYSVGEHRIDEDHKFFLENINIVDELFHSNKEESIKVLDSLHDKLVDHFSYEDDYMLDIKYPRRRSHLERHVEILNEFHKQIYLLKRVETKEEYEKQMLSISMFLRDDIILHSLGEDREYYIWNNVRTDNLK